jgi:thiamine-phosphate pyrophosphorylase
MYESTALRRILDANRNRALEGLRVLEDYARFALDDAALSQACKQLRHGLVDQLDTPAFGALSDARDSAADVGRPELDAIGAKPRAALADVVAANASRAKEALRALEEYARPGEPSAARGLEALRYRLYKVEKSLLSRARREHLRARLSNEPMCLLLGPGEGRPPIEEQLAAALRGGCRFFQLRDKESPDSALLKLSRSLAELCAEHDALLVVNDRADIASLTPGAGLHLGQGDLPVAAARGVVGSSLAVGRSVHDAEELSAALAEDIDYVGVGTIFPSPTKPELGSSGVGLLRALRPSCPHPIFAIGGVTAHNAAEAITAGADGVAVSTAILDSADPERATRALIAAIEAARVGAPPRGAP